MTELFNEIDIRHDGRYHVVDLTQEEQCAVIFAFGPQVLAVFSTPLDEGVHVEMKFYLDGEPAATPFGDDLLTNFEITLTND